MVIGRGDCRLFVDLNFVEVNVEMGAYTDYYYKMLGARTVAQFCKEIGRIPPINLKADERTSEIFTQLFMYYYDMKGEC